MMELKNFEPKNNKDVEIAMAIDSCVIEYPAESLSDNAEEVQHFEASIA